MQHTTRITTALMLSAIALFTACKKESSNTDQLASLGKATLTGKVFAVTVDTPGAADAQYAPSGTTIQAWIDTHDLVAVPAAGVTYAKRYFTTTVDASGNYSLSIDVSKYQGATVHFQSPTFAHDVITKMYPDSIKSTRHIFQQYMSATPSVTNGTTNVVDLNFN